MSVIGDYLATIEDEATRDVLTQLADTLHALLPEAEEGISYGLPALKVQGKVVAGFAVTAKGLSYYPFSGGVTAKLADELAGFKTSKGAVTFTVDSPLPEALVKLLVETRLAELSA